MLAVGAPSVANLAAPLREQNVAVIEHTAIPASTAAEITSVHPMEESAVPMDPSAQAGNTALFSTANRLAARISAAKNSQEAAAEVIPAPTPGAEEQEAGIRQRR